MTTMGGHAKMTDKDCLMVILEALDPLDDTEDKINQLITAIAFLLATGGEVPDKIELGKALGEDIIRTFDTWKLCMETAQDFMSLPNTTDKRN